MPYQFNNPATSRQPQRAAPVPQPAQPAQPVAAPVGQQPQPATPQPPQYGNMPPRQALPAQPAQPGTPPPQNMWDLAKQQRQPQLQPGQPRDYNMPPQMQPMQPPPQMRPMQPPPMQGRPAPQPNPFSPSWQPPQQGQPGQPPRNPYEQFNQRGRPAPSRANLLPNQMNTWQQRFNGRQGGLTGGRQASMQRMRQMYGGGPQPVQAQVNPTPAQPGQSARGLMAMSPNNLGR